MEKHVFVVFTMPEEDREEEYNDWYTNVHLPDLLAIDGFVAAQRFELSPLDPPQNGRYPYLALYEVEGDLDEARAALAKARERMHITGAINPDDAHTTWYTAITERAVADEVD